MSKRDHNYARADAGEIIQEWNKISAGSKIVPELGAKRVNQLIVMLANALISQGKDNQIMTRVMRIGGWLTPAILEYLNGEGAYRQNAPRLRVVLRNKTSRPIEVETDVLAHNGIDWDGQETTAFYVSEPISETVQPGETITVSSHFAVNNMYNRCKESWFTAGQRAGYKHPDELEEVGYSAEIGNQIIRFPAEDPAPSKARKQ